MTHRILDHTADIQYLVSANSLEKMFVESAKVMQKSFCEDKVREKIEKKIKVAGKDLENLMYNFLEELLFLFDTEHFLFSRIELKINPKKDGISAMLFGETVQKHEIFSHVKAITYNEMYVKKKGSKWECLITLDV